MSLGARWLKFNAVGLAGVGVQLAALALYQKVLGIQYLWATALAVETAVPHNFVWHVRWTWKERTPETGSFWAQLVRFHVGNGLISIAANVALMRWLKGGLGLPLLWANAISIGITAAANFVVSELWVFRGKKSGNSLQPKGPGWNL